MARVNHGYVILNFRRFHDKDHTAAARQARYRLKKTEELRHVTSRNAVTGRNVTQGRGKRVEGREDKKEGATGGANGHTAVAVFCDTFKAAHGVNPSSPAIGRASKGMKSLIAEHGEAVYGAAVAAYFASKDKYVLKHTHDPKYFVDHFDDFSLTA